MTQDHEVQKAYEWAVEEVQPALDALDLDLIARHNRNYLDYEGRRIDAFVHAESRRYLHTARLIASTVAPGGAILDVGCFIPVLPLMLRRLGFEVSVAEKFSLYENALEGVASLVQKCGIRVVDADLVLGNTPDLSGTTFDAVLALALIEHLNGSPRKLLANCRALLKPEESKARLFLEVPNITSLNRRLRLLLGRSPFQPIKGYYESEYPFSGHNHEYTKEEVRYVLEASGFKIQSLDCRMYSDPKLYTWKGKLVVWASSLLPQSFREVVFAVASP